MTAGTRLDPFGQSLATILPRSSTAAPAVHPPEGMADGDQTPPVLVQYTAWPPDVPTAIVPAVFTPLTSLPVGPSSTGAVQPPEPLGIHTAAWSPVEPTAMLVGLTSN